MRLHVITMQNRYKAICILSPTLKAPARTIGIGKILMNVCDGIRVMPQCCKSHLVNLVSFRCDTSITVMIGDLVTSSGLHFLSCSVLVTPCLVTYSSCD